MQKIWKLSYHGKQCIDNFTFFRFNLSKLNLRQKYLNTCYTMIQCINVLSLWRQAKEWWYNVYNKCYHRFHSHITSQFTNFTVKDSSIWFILVHPLAHLSSPFSPFFLTYDSPHILPSPWRPTMSSTTRTYDKIQHDIHHEVLPWHPPLDPTMISTMRSNNDIHHKVQQWHPSWVPMMTSTMRSYSDHHLISHQGHENKDAKHNLS